VYKEAERAIWEERQQASSKTSDPWLLHVCFNIK